MKIWILNHYATNMYFDEAGRHQSLAKYLINMGCDVNIFCANTVHNSDVSVDVGNEEYINCIGVDQVQYTFIKTRPYSNNGKQRIGNMLDYYHGVKKILMGKSEIFGRPDVIIASSVHPLTLIAGEKIARKFGIPCICEIRDLWPESLVSYGFLRKNGFITKLLRFGERKIYEKADALVFTMEGGRDYIVERRWNIENGGSIDLDKVHYINNGVDIELFNINKHTHIYHDKEWNSFVGSKIVYTGSIRLTNHLEYIIDAAQALRNRIDLGFFIFGEGDKKDELEKKCKDLNLKNVYFKGKVEKKYVPNILANCDICITDMYSSELFKYGISPNKVFDYIAAKKPIISGLISNYDIVRESAVGITLDSISADEICRAIYKILSMDKASKAEMSIKYEHAARLYDFKNLAHEYLKIIYGVLKNKK